MPKLLLKIDLQLLPLGMSLASVNMMEFGVCGHHGQHVEVIVRSQDQEVAMVMEKLALVPKNREDHALEMNVLVMCVHEIYTMFMIMMYSSSP